MTAVASTVGDGSVLPMAVGVRALAVWDAVKLLDALTSEPGCVFWGWVAVVLWG